MSSECTCIGEEPNDVVRCHLGRPRRRREHQRVLGTRILRVLVEHPRFPRRLCARARDDHDMLEPVRVKCFPRQLDSGLALLACQELRFAVTPLYEDAGDASLGGRV